MKGVLGLGAASTAYFLEQIHQQFNLNNNAFSTCPLLLYQIDFQEINPFLPTNFQELMPKLEKYLQQIEKLGIDKLLIPNITLHETLDQIHYSIVVCHPVTLTVNYLKSKNYTNAVIFGTKYTMNSSYIKGKFAFENIESLLPSETDQIKIDTFRKKVYSKSETDHDVLSFQELITKYSRANPVIIACTELSVYSLKNDDNCIDMAELQIHDFLN